MARQRKGRLELRFLGPGPRGQIEREDGSSVEFDGWTDLGRAIHDLAGLDGELASEKDPKEEGIG